MKTRREYVKQTPALIGLLMGIPAFLEAKQGVKKLILLRSSWQTINIGDIAHTPGVIALLEKYLPDVEVRLWASDVRDGVEEMLVSVAISSSHVGFCGIRLEPTWSALGQAAGLAAHLSIKNGVSVTKVKVPELQSLLVKNKTKIIYVSDVDADSPYFETV